MATFIATFMATFIVTFLYLANRLQFSVRVYCNRSQMTSQRVYKKKYDTRRSRVSDCCSLHAVTSSVIYYTALARNEFNIFVLYNKNSNGFKTLKNLGSMKKEEQVC